MADSQSGYTAISLETLRLLDLDRLYARYGFPNDLLVHLNVWNRRVRDYPSRPIYGVGEQSGIRLRKVVPTISWLLLKGFFWRMKEKYVIRDFHPLVLFYLLGMSLAGAGFALGLARGRPPLHGEPDPGGDHRPRRPARRLGAPASPLRHVVRHGVQQGAHGRSTSTTRLELPAGVRIVVVHEGSQESASSWRRRRRPHCSRRRRREGLLAQLRLSARAARVPLAVSTTCPRSTRTRPSASASSHTVSRGQELFHASIVSG